jgi:hypothetical protein
MKFEILNLLISVFFGLSLIIIIGRVIDPHAARQTFRETNLVHTAPTGLTNIIELPNAAGVANSVRRADSIQVENP